VPSWGTNNTSKMFPLQRQGPSLPPTRRQTPSRRNRRRIRHYRQRRRSQTQWQQPTVLRDESRCNTLEQSSSRHLLAQDSSELRLAWVAYDGMGDAISGGEEGGCEESDQVGEVCYC